jgi:hypothetical protein
LTPACRNLKAQAALSTPSLRFEDFVEFQSTFMRMNHQIDAAERPLIEQKDFHGLGRAFPSPCGTGHVF